MYLWFSSYPYIDLIKKYTVLGAECALLFQGIVALLQKITGGSIGLAFLGENEDALRYRIIAGEIDRGAAGTFEHSSRLAIFAVFVLLLVIFNEENKKKKYIMVALGFVVLYLAGSRTAKFVFSLSGESDVIQRTPLKTIVSAIRTIINKYDANLFLIPTGCGEHCKDRDFLKQIDDEVNDTRITVINAEFSPQDLVTFLARVDVIISSRLHLNILGACAAVPSIGLVRNTKIIDFATLMNLPYLELEDLKSEEIVEAVDHIFSEKVKRSEYITSVVGKMKEQYLTALNKAKELIEHF